MTAQNSRRGSSGARASAKSQDPAADVVDAAETRDGLRVAAAAQRVAFERFERLYEESLRFATSRFEDNRNTLQELAQATSLQDQMAIWSRYVERTIQQYTDNLGALAGLYGEQVRETVQDGAEAAQAAAAAVAEVTPSPMAGATPPLPGIDTEVVAPATPKTTARKAAPRPSTRGPAKAATQKTAAPKSAEPKTAEPKAEAPKTAEPKAETAKAAEPKAETPKSPDAEKS